MMVDQGYLNYEDTVAKHWPEFAKNGKGSITVAQLMRHEAGLARFSKPIPLEFLTAENIKKNKVGEIIENEKIEIPEGYTRVYHGVNRDWISNELFRRVEPQGRTFGEYLDQELCSKILGGADIYIGTEKLDKCFVSRMVGPATILLSGCHQTYANLYQTFGLIRQVMRNKKS